MVSDPSLILRSPTRLAALRRLALLDTPPEEAFDRLAHLAASVLRTPVAFVSLVDAERQFFKSCLGLPEPWASWRETPLTHSFCQHAIASGQPMAIDDARVNPMFREHPATFDLRIVAYLGIPLLTADGYAIGTFCVIDREPRIWTADEIRILRDLAASVMTEIEMRVVARETARQMDEAERERREKVALLESTVEGIYGLDRDGRCTFINRAGAEMLGYRSDEVLGQNMHQLVHHTHRDGSPFPLDDCAIYQALRSGQDVRLDDELLWRRDGSAFPVEYSASPIVLDGVIQGAVVTFRDISDRKKAEHALRESERQFRALFDSALDAVLIADDDRRYVDANPAASVLFGLSREELLGRRIEDFSGAPAEAVVHMWQEFLRQGEQEGEFVVQRPDGLRRDVEYRAKASFLPGRHLSVLRDVTARKQAEVDRERLLVEAEQRAQRMAEFLRLIAHDIRQPLTIARGQAQLLLRLLDRGDEQRARSSAEAVTVATRRLEAMIRDLVESARLEAGELHLEREPVELTAFVADLCGRLSEALNAERVQVETAEPVVVLADPNRLERILGNLLSNALKYSGPETVVTVRVGERDGQAVVSVSDRGPGIAPEELPHLFERGFRGASATHAEGLGLGLYITRLLVEAHGGRIWAESELGRGSSFYVALPLSTSKRGSL